MDPLFTMRIGGVLQNALIVMTRQNGTAPGRTRSSWPLGKLSVFSDHLEIRLLFNTIELPLRDIESIEPHFLFLVRIKHNNASVPAYVSLYGVGLLSGLRKAVRNHRLPLRVA